MKSKIVTTMEQSRKLLELGIDPSTADMFWDTAEPDKRRKPIAGPISDYDDVENWAIPCWSLSALISLLPIRISIEKGHFYFLEWQFWNDNSLRYVNPYSDERKCLVDIYSDHDEKLKDCIDTAFEMICYLKENKLI